MDQLVDLLDVFRIRRRDFLEAVEAAARMIASILFVKS
jgi:hypothetical protein